MYTVSSYLNCVGKSFVISIFNVMADMLTQINHVIIFRKSRFRESVCFVFKTL